MARAKRSLEEADPNIEPAPPAKRTFASEALGKENGASSASASPKDSNSSTVPKDKDGRVPHEADGKTWICVCRPIREIIKENDMDEDDEEDIESFRHHTWILTKKGLELDIDWQTQKERRDQDNFGMYIFNDFSGYGIVEVMENILLAFDKEYKKKTKDPLVSWSHMEGLALFLNSDLFLWRMIDDPEGNAKLVALIGVAILSTIDLLVKEDLFTADRPVIRNIGLILSHFLAFADCYSDTCQHNENGWAAVLVKRAEEHSVSIKGLVGIEETIQKVRDTLDHTGGKWKSWNWKKEFGRYSATRGVKIGLGDPSSGGIGGNYYDLLAEENKGPHMKRCMLGGESDGSDGEDSA